MRMTRRLDIRRPSRDKPPAVVSDGLSIGVGGPRKGMPVASAGSGERTTPFANAEGDQP